MIQNIGRVAEGDNAGLVLNELGLHPLGYALPPGVPFRYVPTVAEAGAGTLTDTEGWNTRGLNAPQSQAPLTLRCTIDGEKKVYNFPLDPILSVNGKNIITRRYVAKGSLTGTVKESWSQDDWDVTIAGVLMGTTAEELNDMVRELYEILASGEVIDVENDWLQGGYGITQVVVDSWQFPHTKGLTNQTFTIKCYSDSSINILEEV